MGTKPTSKHPAPRSAPWLLRNKTMERKLNAGICKDVSACQRKGDFYVLSAVMPGMDYCNAQTEQWIWSIGRHNKSGEILASHTTNFYQHPRFDCLWLRSQIL